MLGQNAKTTPSPEIAKEMSQKNDAVTISPQKDYRLGMHSKNISWCQTEELDDSDSAHRNIENFSDDSNSPRQHHQINKPFKKIFNPQK